MGFTDADPPFVGYYNRGLTLLETREPAVPGVTFRVEARVLEHTLTRDNVIRDRNHQAVLKAVAALAGSTLRDAHIAALQAAIAAGDEPRHASLLAVTPPERLPGDLPCLRTADGGLTCLDALRPGLLRRLLGGELLCAPGPSPLVDALVAAGRVVLAGPPRPEVPLAVRLGLGQPVEVHARWILPALREPHPLTEAASDDALRILSADFDGRGDAVQGRLLTWQDAPGTLEERRPGDAPPRRVRAALVDTGHPTFLRLAALPIPLAAPLLRHIVRVGLGTQPPMSPSTLTTLLESTR
jgi:hypothetical protein